MFYKSVFILNIFDVFITYLLKYQFTKKAIFVVVVVNGFYFVNGLTCFSLAT